MMIRLSVVIITWNQLACLKECLQSLCWAMEEEDIEIILVDNGSEDGTLSYIKDAYPKIRTLINPTNRGVAYARNRGLEVALGENVLLLDNDTIANKEAIQGMESYLETHAEVGLCTCRLVDKENCVQESFKPFPGLWIKLKNVLGMGSLKKTVLLPADMNTPFEPVYVIGACQMIRKKVIERIGLLDETIFYGPEDADYCLRIVADGWKVVYLPHYTIIHQWRRATTRKLISRLAWKHFCALCYFYVKYKRIN